MPLNNDQLILTQTDNNSNDTLTFIALGDYGWNGTAEQLILASKLDEVAAQVQAQFILGLQDNFYNPSGVTGLDDPNWDLHWRNIFQVKPYLQNLKWYGTLGNHDYQNTGLLSQLQYNQSGWQIDTFFWNHIHVIGSTNQKVAFVHFDTNYLAYGPEGEEPVMASYFKNFTWFSNSQMIDQAKFQLDLVKHNTSKDDWIITVGHHMIGGTCTQLRSTGELFDLIQDYPVSAYIHGHSHSQAFGKQKSVGFYLSGAGGDDSGNCPAKLSDGQKWSKGHVYGFVVFKIDKSKINAQYIYQTINDTKWQTYDADPIDRKTSNSNFLDILF